jgi:hypothetical protein
MYEWIYETADGEEEIGLLLSLGCSVYQEDFGGGRLDAILG